MKLYPYKPWMFFHLHSLNQVIIRIYTAEKYSCIKKGLLISIGKFIPVPVPF